MIDFVVACFIHFLARVPAFIEEASAPVSEYHESTCIASLIFEAILRCDQPKSFELAGIVLRVTERVNHFVDREDPWSDKVHKAAYVVKYVAEKRCPELGKRENTLQGVSRGCMPKDLFELGQVVPAAPVPELRSGQVATSAESVPCRTATPPETPALVDTQPALVSVGDDGLADLAEAPPPSMENATVSRPAASAVPGDLSQPCPEPATLSPMPNHGVASEIAAATPDGSSVAPRRLSYTSILGRDSTTRRSAGMASTGRRRSGQPSSTALATHLEEQDEEEQCEAKRRRTDSPEP